MAEKNDWRAAARDARTRERHRLGEPPTPEEVVAFSRGELPEADAARVRALLIAYPHLTSVVLDNDEDARDVLFDADVERDLAAIRSRIPAHAQPDTIEFPERSRSSPSRLLPIAAGVCVATLTALLVHSHFRIQELSRERDLPRLHTIRHELTPLDPQRGATPAKPYPLTRGEESYLLVPLVFDEPAGTAYRLNVIDFRSPARPIWSSRVSLAAGEALGVSIPRAFFEPGITYLLDLHQDGASDSKPAASYLVRVEP